MILSSKQERLVRDFQIVAKDFHLAIYIRCPTLDWPVKDPDFFLIYHDGLAELFAGYKVVVDGPGILTLVSPSSSRSRNWTERRFLGMLYRSLRRRQWSRFPQKQWKHYLYQRQPDGRFFIESKNGDTTTGYYCFYSELPKDLQDHVYSEETMLAC